MRAGAVANPHEVTDMIRKYTDGTALRGTASRELLEASEAEGSGTGAVPAYRDSDGVWQYVEPSNVEHYVRNLKEDVVIVYVEVS